MATSKKDPPNPSRGRTSPNLMSSSSESSGHGYGARRARSVPSSAHRKFGSSSPSVSASGSTDVHHSSLFNAGRSISSRTMGSSIQGTKAQPFPSAASKPTLAKEKSDKVSTTLQRPPVLAVPAAKASPSTLPRSKPSPRPSSDSCKAAASLKPSSQRVMLPGAAQGDKVQPLSTAQSPGAAARKRLDTVNGATTNSKAKSVSQKAMGASSARKEKHKDPSMQIKGTECINTTTSIEEHLHKELPDPVDLKSMEMTVPDQHEPSFNEPEHVLKDDEKSEGHFSEEKVDAGANEIHNGGQDDNGGVKTIYECGIVEKKADRSVDKTVPKTEVAQVWRKDDPKGNDVIEETKSKLLLERKSRVKALVGAFETVLSFKE
ncbi:hypothetical protein Zm00014a_021898 [Zea mays]|jgi:hypothetical protein|uniref:Calmodulin-binding domain-containing protein n=2 Tax=Zea mays TaxID=4577 RepID=B4FCQ7_MAIZE|nr:uncharacterized protein LOC100192811 [Zea mays]XP_020400456.1 uncharacterized protein LOC100192811 isoform X1 [Zea mays]ACF79900.1 unknown [Zea mays]AQK42972.1 hypothetical protein ZEAMMB73_Zm00001d025107 [Zea mays]PWZ45511.1 hypothetical protein Zm00014a_021898 [Zea mays]|eukprot:NP_001131476.1 uncharacterized protein LOC100192811 [Zea mays]